MPCVPLTIQNVHIPLIKALFPGTADTVFYNSRVVEKTTSRSAWLLALEQRQPTLSAAVLAMWLEVPPALC